MMNTRITAIICLFLGFSLQGNTQKIKTANEDLSYSYMRLPIQDIDAGLTTYSRNLIGGGDLGKYGVQIGSYTSNLTIAGKKHLPTGGHLLYEMTIDNPFVKVNKVEKVTSKVKDKEGKESTVTSFEPRVSFDLPVSYRLIDYKNNVIFENSFIEEDNSTTISAKGYSTEAAAKKALAAKISADLKSKISSITYRISDYLSANYGYTEMKSNVRMFSIKPKKLPQQPAFQKSVDHVKAAFAKVKPGVDISTVETSIQSDIDYWVETAKGVTAGDKKTENLKYACLYNLTRTYTLLQKSTEAKKYLSSLKKLSMNKGEVSNLAKEVDSITETLAKYPIKGLYYLNEPKSVDPPSSVAYGLGEGAAVSGPSTSSISVPSNCHLKEGTIFYNGKEKSAAFILPNVSVEGSPINLVPDDGFKMYAYNGSDFEEMKILLDLKAGDYFTFDKVNYTLQKADKGKYFDIKEVLYESDKIVCYAINSMNRKPMIPKFRMKKKSDSSIWVPKGLSEASWKKSMKEYFSDCPSIGTSVIDKVPIEDETFLHQVGEYYTKNCK